MHCVWVFSYSFSFLQDPQSKAMVGLTSQIVPGNPIHLSKMPVESSVKREFNISPQNVSLYIELRNCMPVSNFFLNLFPGTAFFKRHFDSVLSSAKISHWQLKDGFHLALTSATDHITF